MSDFNTEQEIRDYLAQQADWLNRGIISQTQYNQAVRDTKVGIKGFAAQLQQSQEQLKKSVVGLATSIAKGDSGAKVYNNALNAGAKAIDSYAQKFGFWGKVAGTVATAAAKYAAAVNEQADLLFENYQDLSRSGLANGLEDTFKNLQKMGYTTKEIGQMGALMKENATMFAQFGGTAANGAKEFAKLSKEIQYSDLGTQFKMMGMTVDDINKGSANYLKLQQISGTLQSQTTEQLTKGSAAYIVQQDKMTKLTGATADEQTKILEDAYRQERYAAKQYQLRVLDGSEQAKKQADFNDAYLQTMTKKGGSAAGKAAQAMVVGAANDPEYIKARRSMSGANEMIRAGATDAAQVFDQSTKDATKTQKDWNLLARAGKSSDNIIDYSTLVNLGGQQAKSMEEAAKAADKQQAAQRSGADKGVKNMVDITQSQRNQTMTAEKGINVGLETTTSVMSTFAETIEGATDALGGLVGTEGRVGGGSTWFGKIKNAITGGGGKTSAPGAAPAAPSGGGASAPTSPSPPAPAGSTPGASVAPAAGGAAGAGSAAAVNATPGEKSSGGGESGGVVGAAKSAVSKAGGSMVAGMDAIKQMIIKHEGIKTRPYQDSLGLWTVGVGHLIGNGKSLPADMNREFSKDEVMAMFEKDFAHHYKIAQNTPGWDKANETAKGAMIDLAFNMGQWWNKFPNTAKALASGDWAGAAAGLRDSKWASQVKGRASTITGMIEQGGAGAAGKMQTAAMGGVLGGPKSGYQAMLHGTEAVVPLPDGKTIPVQIAGGDSSQEQIDLLSVELEKLDAMVRMINKQNDLASRILQKQS
jgi:lysozyme